MEGYISLLFFLFSAHWVCDYPLQGDFLANAKQKGPLRVYHLVAHAGIQGGAVALVTGNVWLGICEWAAHTVIDEMKTKGLTSFATDQFLHILCKIIWVAVIIYGVPST